MSTSHNVNSRTNIVGAKEMGIANTIELNTKIIHETNSLFWDTIGNDLLGTTALPYYGPFLSDEKFKFFDDLAGKKLLEIGCGSGQSLKYVGERQAEELWGIDISEAQVNKTKHYLESCGLCATLICSPMEEECGVPVNYFDLVHSIYAIGWTTDLQGTFNRIASYLKKDGVFIFSWSHPIHKCVVEENNTFVFKKRYFDESWYSVSIQDSELSLTDRTLSTYVNALSKAGFVIEQMIEESDEDTTKAKHDTNDFAKKANMLPVTLVIKARKL